MTVQAVETFSPYSNTSAYWGEGLPTWMDEQDAQRILAYQIYEQIYWNVPDTFKLVLRGEDNSSPIYVPEARTIVDTTSRYIAPKPGFIIDDALGTPEEQALAKQMFLRLFRREKFWSKFNSNKLYGIMRGDWLFHIRANPAKMPMTRISIETIDPAAYFPVSHPTDPERIIAVHIVEQINIDGDTYIKRQTYQRGADPINNLGEDTTIWNSVGIFEVDAWYALNDKAVTIVKPPTPLPPQITAIPIYHVPNIESPGDPFGSSELRGFERIFAALHQAISDEELALALEGLGMYETDGGPPRDENGNITDWILGPGRVIEHAHGTKFSRVNGVSSVEPVQNHLDWMIRSLRTASGTPDAAVGKVDVQVAESGISLVMQLSPLLAKAEVRNDTIAGVMNQMMYDLRAWFSAYEQYDTPCVAEMVFGNPVPENRKERIQEILDIFGAGLADAAWAQEELNRYGYVFPTDMPDRILTEAAARAAAADPFGTRLAAEAEVDEGTVA